MAAVLPAAKTLFLCEEVDKEWGRTNLYGLFHRLTAPLYPHTVEAFHAFAQLAGGLGEVLIHMDIRRAVDQKLVFATAVQPITFARRTQLVEVSWRVEGAVFPSPGVYLVELYCNNQWAGDVTLDVGGGVG